MTKKGKQGWYHEGRRHSLAARGISTGRKGRKAETKKVKSDKRTIKSTPLPPLESSEPRIQFDVGEYEIEKAMMDEVWNELQNWNHYYEKYGVLVEREEGFGRENYLSDERPYQYINILFTKHDHGGWKIRYYPDEGTYYLKPYDQRGYEYTEKFDNIAQLKERLRGRFSVIVNHKCEYHKR